MPESVLDADGLENLDRGDRVEIPELDVDGTVVDCIGQMFGGTGVAITDGDQRYLVSTDNGEIVVDHWNGLTYRDVLDAGRIDPGHDHVVIQGDKPSPFA